MAVLCTFSDQVCIFFFISIAFAPFFQLLRVSISCLFPFLLNPIFSIWLGSIFVVSIITSHYPFPPSLIMLNVASNSSHQFECGPISELNPLKLEETPETTTTLVNMDFISNLPESVLCLILSFLPTRSAVATSVLSRRWRHLWKYLQVLDFVDEHYLAIERARLAGHEFVFEPYDVPGRSKQELKECFVGFVNAVLSHVCLIQKFRLACEVLDHYAISSWIDSVIKPQLQELHIKLFSPSEFQLPSAVFSCPSLVSLTFECDIMLDDLPHVHLPSLKNLKLNKVYHIKFDTLLSGCPVLETLVVILPLCWTCNEAPQAVHMPHSLKSLTLLTDDRHGETIEHLEIDAPSLEYLHIRLEPCHLGVSVGNFPNMLKACLDIRAAEDSMEVGWVPEVLKALCKTRSLVLTDYTTQFLLRVPTLDFLEFGCLHRLQIEFHTFNSKFLVDLLHSCHKLQVFIIHANKKHFGDYLFLKFSEPSGWMQPISVPNCVISHLNTVEFRGYQDSAEEHEFASYILQRGLVLKAMTIHTDNRYGQERKDLILKELSIVPRGSSICQLKLG